MLLLTPPPLNADDESNSVPETVIDNYEIAEKKYMASYLYAIHKCRMEAKNLEPVYVFPSLRLQGCIDVFLLPMPIT